MEKYVNYKGVKITREAILKEISNFDALYKDTNAFNNWLDSDNYKFAIFYNGKKYPHKHILSKVSGFHADAMLGGLAIADIFTRLGFTVEEKNKEINKRYFRLGANEKIWQRCISDNNYATGEIDWVKVNKDNAWYLLGDLSRIKENREAIKHKVNKTFSDINPQQVDSKVKDIWDFLHVNIGDYIIVTQSTKQVYGYGKVTGSYQYREDYDNCKHAIPVIWIDTSKIIIPDGFKEVLGNWTGKSFLEISEELFNKLISIGNAWIFQKDPKILDHEATKLLLKKKQIILYGPPGTGKTYNSKKIALDLLKKGNNNA